MARGTSGGRGEERTRRSAASRSPRWTRELRRRSASCRRRGGGLVLVLGLGRPGGLGFELRTRRRRGCWPEVVDEEGEKGRRRAHTVGGGGGEGIVRLDFGAREAMGRGCGRVGAERAAGCATANSSALLVREVASYSLLTSHKGARKSQWQMATRRKPQADPAET